MMFDTKDVAKYLLVANEYAQRGYNAYNQLAGPSPYRAAEERVRLNEDSDVVKGKTDAIYISKRKSEGGQEYQVFNVVDFKNKDKVDAKSIEQVLIYVEMYRRIKQDLDEIWRKKGETTALTKMTEQTLLSEATLRQLHNSLDVSAQIVQNYQGKTKVYDVANVPRDIAQALVEGRSLTAEQQKIINNAATASSPLTQTMSPDFQKKYYKLTGEIFGVDGYSKNDIIKLIESGILADTSVGWGTTRESYKCNICGNSIYDYRHCEHIPGKKYIVNEETNEVKECIIQAEPPKELHAGNNVLMENSIVFDGAYPNAIIQSAFGEEVETPTGKFKKLEGKQDLSEKDVILGYSTAGGNINLLYKETLEKGGKGKMEGNENVNELENQEIETNEENLTPTTEQTPESTPENNLSVETGTDTETKPETSGNEEMSVEKAILEKFDNICDTVDELVQMAKEGLENRNSVIAKALDSGVHSMGNAFDKNIFTKTFSNMKTKDIEQMGKVWEEQADNKFSKTKISKQEFANQEKKDEFKRVGLEQFKTSNY